MPDAVDAPTAADAPPAAPEEAAGRGAAEAAARPDPADEIGARLAACRTARGFKVSQLARVVGVSPSLISQIERGQSRPSVSTLFALAEALEVPVDVFFARGGGAGDDDTLADLPEAGAGASPRTTGDPDQQPPAAAVPRPEEPSSSAHRYLVRLAERAAIDIEGGVRWERLTPTTLPGVEFLELVYGPRAQSNAGLYRHPGTEMVLLLAGRLDIFVGFDCHELEPGDSIHFPSSMPHRYVNPTDEEARAVTVILHDELDPSGPAQQRRP